MLTLLAATLVVIGVPVLICAVRSSGRTRRKKELRRKKTLVGIALLVIGAALLIFSFF